MKLAEKRFLPASSVAYGFKERGQVTNLGTILRGEMKPNLTHKLVSIVHSLLFSDLANHRKHCGNL